MRISIVALAAACGLGTGIGAHAQCGNTSTGADVIVGDLNGIQNWNPTAPVGGIYAYSIGTTSCNIGSVPLNWFASTNQHPVIGQNIYRLRTVNGSTRFEQIGQSWLKHGFAALSGTVCCSNCAGDPTQTHLGVGCSDPYTASRNGSQSNLGPRSQVNPSTGVYPYPWSAPAAPATIGRRIQVAAADLDPAQNSGALYFGEAQYVTPDDAAAGNKNNNASYRRLTTSGTTGSTLALTATTQRRTPAIQAWRDHGLGVGVPDTAVTVGFVDVPSDGRFNYGFKVTDLGGGRWHYEYAVHNMNSFRAGGSFSVPVPPGVTVTNIGFHDVNSHSGEPYDNTDWTGVRTSGAVTWTSPQTFAQNPNSNAIRWGTTYNFRFDTDVAPVDGVLSIGLFKPGTPETAVFRGAVAGAPPCSVDIDGDGVVNVGDYLAYLGLYSAADARADFTGDGAVDVSDYLAFLAAFAAGC
jgi:hypothetical protein